MMKTATDFSYAALSDQDLIQKIFTEGDRLPMEFAQEAISRGPRLLPLLADVIQSSENWQRDDTGFWSVIHASYLLGAIGGEEAVPALIEALYCSIEFDNDWIMEEFPSIFASLGPCALESLKKAALDAEEDWYLRNRAMAGMASMTLRHPDYTDQVFSFIAGIAANEEDDPETRSWAGGILADFQRKEHEPLLKSLVKSGITYGHFDENDIQLSWTSPKDLYWYKRNWLDFYSPENIANRQKRWETERLPEDKAWERAMADPQREERELPPLTRKQAAKRLGDLLPLAQKLDQKIGHESSYLFQDELRENLALAMELHEIVQKDRRKFHLFESYLKDLSGWITELPNSLSKRGLVDESLRIISAWREFCEEDILLAERALILARAGRETEARNQIRENLEQYPDDTWMHIKAADAYREMKDFSSAEEEYWESLDMADRDYDREGVLERLIPLLRETGKPEEAASLEAEERQREERRKMLQVTGTAYVRSGPKIGRNDPCSCGSGKKYKKCCLSKA